MTSRQDHVKFIEENNHFEIDCNHQVFSNEQIKILEQYGHWFKALTSGELEPITDLQKRFISVAKKELEPETKEEKAWFLYLGRKAVEDKLGDKLKVQYKNEEDTFYNREQAKKEKRKNYGESRKNHNV
jgi:uncharacterized protein